MSEYQDKERKCVENDCESTFVITAGEQEFFATKGFALPKRCKDCRARKKRENASPFGKTARDMRRRVRYN